MPGTSRAHQQLSGFLLRRRCHYGRSAGTKLYRRWLAGLKFEQAVHHIVMEDYIAAIEAAETRRDRLTAQIGAILPDWSLAPHVGDVGAPLLVWPRCRKVLIEQVGRERPSVMAVGGSF